MCGIAGVFTADGTPPADAMLDALAAALAHRGPDGHGRYRARGIGMVHTRLAIIDLKTGDQPIMERPTGDGGAALIANAEIYNYRELRDDLAGVAFATASDCEPPLHLWRRHGLDFAQRLRGMYALAIHDPGANSLVLARDPFGIKPLYYVERPDCFAFASEPQALLAAGLAGRGLDDGARDQTLQLQFSTGRDTLFRDIKRVLPGETMMVGDGRVIERRRRATLPAGAPLAIDDADALARLDRALDDTVLFHQRADVPFGMFFSGGIDSTVLLAVMARLNDQPVRAFTAGFPGTPVPDERAQARALAATLGADYVEVDVGEADFWRTLPAIAQAVDDACADYAVVPSYALARTAAKDLKVVLCGEGGDEILAGYGRYRSVLRPRILGGRGMRMRGIFDGMEVLRTPPPAWRDGIVAGEATAALPGRSRLQVAQASDCADWLPNDLLVKLDRCLMAHGLEGRTPFLDPVFADFAYRLPDRLKIRGGHGKWLLRSWLEAHLPAARAFARKRGFTVPVAHWIAGQGGRIGGLVAAQPGIVELCRPDSVQALFARRGKRPGFAAWTLLFYALWHSVHVLERPAQGDAFEVLADAARHG